MHEIEVKILDIDKAEVIKKLESLNAKKILAEDVVSYYYDFPDKRLINSGIMLRARKLGNKILLTSKQKLPEENSNVKLREEHQITISNMEILNKIFNAIGLEKYKEDKKERISYLLDDARIEIDTLENIPTFIEIEATSEEKVRTYVEKLGFTMEDAKPWSTKQVLEHYISKPESS